MKRRPPTRDVAASRPPRNRVLAIVDIVVSVLLVFACLGVSIQMGSSAAAYAQYLHEGCTPQLVDGMVCNGGVLSAVTIGLTAVAVLGFAVAIGMVIVNFVRRRYTFWWPLGVIVISVGLFYLGTWILGMTIPTVSAS